MNALEALRDDDFHAEKAGALGGPVAARAGPVFLAGEDNERDPVGLVGHAGVIDESWLASLALISLSAPGPPLAKIKGVSAFDAGNHQVLDAHVGEGAAGHDPVVAAAGAVAVEILRSDAVLEEIFTSRSGLLDGARRADVVGGDANRRRCQAGARP